MKHKLLFLAALLAAMILPKSSMAQAYDFSAVAPSGQTLYYYSLDEDDDCIDCVYVKAPNGLDWNGYEKPTGDLVIPDSVTYEMHTYAVIGIGLYAFYQCRGLTSIHFGNSLTRIGLGAFEGCSGLTGDLVIPDAVVEIDDLAFYKCVGLSSVHFGNSLTLIGLSAFEGCSGFTGELTIPNSVVEIGGSAFFQCRGLTSVVMNTEVRPEQYSKAFPPMTVIEPGIVTEVSPLQS